MKKKNGKTHAAAKAKQFDMNYLVPETGITITPRSEDTIEMFNKLDALQIGQSYKMPSSLTRVFNNARSTHKRHTKKVFISRKIDNYNIRCWRLADDTILVTRQAKKKK